MKIHSLSIFIFMSHNIFLFMIWWYIIEACIEFKIVLFGELLYISKHFMNLNQFFSCYAFIKMGIF